MLFAATGCHSVHISKQMQVDLPIAKAKIIQLRVGMKRNEVEKILNPLPKSFYDGPDISGTEMDQYWLTTEISVQLLFISTDGILVQEPQELLVTDNNINHGYRRVSLSKIK